MRLLLCLLGVSLLLCGCQQSPQKNYYLLNAQAVTGSGSYQADAITVAIAPVEVVDYLDRNNLTTIGDSGRLHVMSNTFWAEPLDKGIARALTLNLMAVEPTLNVMSFPWRAETKPNYTVRLKILELTRRGNTAHLHANWTLVGEGNQTVHQARFIDSVVSGSSAADLTESYSQLVARLSAEIAKAIVH